MASLSAPYSHNEESLIELANVIHSYRWICDMAPVDFLYRLGKGQAQDLFSEQELAPLLSEHDGMIDQWTDLIDIPIASVPPSLGDFVALLQRVLAYEQTLKAQSQHYADRPLPKPPSSHLWLGMKPKKQYEVAMMTRLITSILAAQSKVKNVIEMGTGCGYLTSFLAVQLGASEEPVTGAGQTGFQYVGLDYNARNVRSAQERHERIAMARQYRCCKSTPVHFVECHIAHPPVSSAYEACLAKCFDWSHGRKALMLGLHGCGDLSSSMLRLFRDDERYQVLVQVGCCYHLLSESCSLDAGFPLSHILRSRGFRLGRYLRNLACSSPERDAAMTFGERLGRSLRLHFHSALFHVMLISEGIVTLKDSDGSSTLDESPSLLHLGSLRSLAAENFVSFCQLLFERLKMKAIPEATLLRYESLYKKYYLNMSFMLILQRWMGTLVEQCISLDRVLACREFGLSAELVLLFDRVQSPRSHVLLVHK